MSVTSAGLSGSELSVQTHDASARRNLWHFPLEFRSAFRSQALRRYLEETRFPVHPVECVDVAQETCSPVSLATSRKLAWLVYGRALTMAEVAASLSHRKAWLSAYESGCSWGVFYEDDVNPKSSQLEASLGALEAYETSDPLFINFLPAQQVPLRAPAQNSFLNGLAISLTSVSTYTTNAQAYAINRAGLEKILPFLSSPVVRPPDYPPCITLIRHYAVARGELFDIETAGQTTVGDRGSIPMTSRMLRWGLRLSGATYLLSGGIYGSTSNYARYEILQRLEHQIWQRRLG
jgi:GR25 family glycosyltransferase involved in LPS biosynthesis